MKDRVLGFIAVFTVLFLLYSYSQEKKGYTVDELRELYGSGNPALWPKPKLFKQVRKEFQDIGLLPEMTFPKDNPYSKEKEELGRSLFFDEQLSESGKISCATCHRPDKGFADDNMVGIGHNDLEGTRNVMTVLNSGYAKTLFWDGRAATLEEQVKHPIENPVEMNLKMHIALEKVKKNTEYQKEFKKAFGTESISEDQIFKAIATFERTLVSPKSRFDLFVSGKKDEFSNAEIRGLHLFRTKANCINCHNTPYFSDGQFHNIGLDFFSKNKDDMGRYEFTKNPLDKRKFKTPSLRENRFTKPYMHNGEFPEIRNVLMMYNVGMGKENLTSSQKKDPNFPKKSKMIKRIDLSDDEISDLSAFLRTLQGYKNENENTTR